MCVCVCVHTTSAVGSGLSVGGAGAAVGVVAGGAGGVASCRVGGQGVESGEWTGGGGLLSATEREPHTMFTMSTWLANKATGEQ